MDGNVLHYKQDQFQEPEDPNNDFPAVPLSLLYALERRFPDRLPDVTMPEREIWTAVGRAQIVRFLREMHERPRV